MIEGLAADGPSTPSELRPKFVKEPELQPVIPVLEIDSTATPYLRVQCHHDCLPCIRTSCKRSTYLRSRAFSPREYYSHMSAIDVRVAHGVLTGIAGPTSLIFYHSNHLLFDLLQYHVYGKLFLPVLLTA